MDAEEFREAWKGAADLEACLGLLTENCNMDYVHDAELHSLALGLSATEGDAEMVEHLLVWEGSTADVHADHDGALRIASQNGHEGVVRLLLEMGADVHAVHDEALRNASYNGHAEVVRLLLEMGADVHADDDYALRCASQNGHADVVRLLLEAGADVHADDDFALRRASRNGHEEVVRLLLEAVAETG